MKLELGEKGTVEGISINDTSLPMLAARGGFSFREVLTSPPNLIANWGFENDIDLKNWPIDNSFNFR